MSDVVKKDRSESKQDLITSLEQFCELLVDQKEDEAIADMRKYLEVVKTATEDSTEFKQAANNIVECFDGDHELIAYTLHKSKNPESWTLADQLSNASSRVLNLAKRFQH